jgi:methylthioribulose-1-phosphate dehydratase
MAETEVNQVHSQIEAEKFAELAAHLGRVGQECYRRGWVLGTSGNFSAVLSHEPLRLAITSSGVNKGALTPADVLRVDADAKVIQGIGRPSAETKLHLAVVRMRAAGAVLHTHSVWSTILSDAYATDGGLSIAGYEMLKGLQDVDTHEHEEWLPIIENSQDTDALVPKIEHELTRYPNAHGFLLRRHGLYTWGHTVAEAHRHIEIFEFLLEVVGRMTSSVPGVRP